MDKKWINSIILTGNGNNQPYPLPNQAWTRITIRRYAWSFGHSDPDPSSVKHKKTGGGTQGQLFSLR